MTTCSRHTVHLDRIRAYWDDMLRVAGSLTSGKVGAYDLIRMLSRDGRPTGLGDAFAHYGRIFKTLHLLQFISDGYRRVVRKQLLSAVYRCAVVRPTTCRLCQSVVLACTAMIRQPCVSSCSQVRV
ncbi:hypothetical protein BJ999_000377 [Actinomadura citrea]|uniref:Tn3 transposase DDE domain-containing protein n=1 Tax=Actinomadura citrea TaxID=46158 RepID=A0A7Y9G5G0_9ACTN|nr:hypothetical protein [Actinomadura citrea]